MVMALFMLPVGAQKSNTDILVTPATGEKPDLIGIASIGSVVQGETDYYYRDIPSVSGI